MEEMDVEVREFIKEKVPDWDDPVKATARFKALSGQRSDWEPQFRFWRDLILSIARRFNLLFISPSHLKNRWFNRAGLTPLCLNNVLLEMYKSGDLLRMTDLGDPRSGHLSHLFKKMISFSSAFRLSSVDHVLNDQLLILVPRLEDKAAEAVKSLSESHWTSSCIITMKKFESLFEEKREAYAILSYLSEQGRAKYISIKKKELIEGVKVCLSSAPISSIINVDYDMLQLVWTVEELQQQLDVTDKQCERSKQFALAALRSGDKNIALRNARQLKLASESRAKLLSFLNRVEDVLHVVLDLESTKKVSEAIQVGAQTIKEHRIEAEEVQSCLRELDELMLSQAEVNQALESNTEDDEAIEDELEELELQIRDETLMVSSSIAAQEAAGNGEKASPFTNSLSSAMADLKLQDNTEDPCIQESGSPRNPIGYENLLPS
ncbi:uncharacterized protein LOC141611401 isoform X2 [Silene latifolia]|uniref:uncharacterized protein LOC141611401 isoform X2 n=1 Tax=Silene latifolia TaxID=37657 RepID=UPI003D773670